MKLLETNTVTNSFVIQEAVLDFGILESEPAFAPRTLKNWTSNRILPISFKICGFWIHRLPPRHWSSAKTAQPGHAYRWWQRVLILAASLLREPSRDCLPSNSLLIGANVSFVRCNFIPELHVSRCFIRLTLSYIDYPVCVH